MTTKQILILLSCKIRISGGKIGGTKLILRRNFLETYPPDPLPLSFIKGRGGIGERGFAPL